MSLFSRFMHYDSFERHEAVREFLGDNFEGVVLDAGGLSRSLQPFLPKARIFALNLDGSGDVIYDGQVFPFRSQAFDAVVSLDTLEHIPRDDRLRFVAECLRVAGKDVIIAAPYGSKPHMAYEKKLDDLYVKVHGEHHPWLHEHVVNGLPEAGEISTLQAHMQESGYSAALFYAGDFQRQCQIFERSLILSRALGRVGSFYHLFVSLALWHRLTFYDQPHATANRFYLVGRDHKSTETGRL